MYTHARTATYSVLLFSFDGLVDLYSAEEKPKRLEKELPRRGNSVRCVLGAGLRECGGVVMCTQNHVYISL